MHSLRNEIRTKNRITLIIVPGLSVLCLLAALLLYLTTLGTLQVNASWTVGYCIITGLLVLLSFYIPFIKDKKILTLIFMLKFVFIVIVGYPLGRNFEIEFLLFCSLLLEVNLTLSLPFNTVATALLLILMFLNQQPITAWGKKLAAPPLANLIVYGIFLLTVSILAAVMSYFGKKWLNETNVADKLNQSIARLTDANIGFQQYAKTASEKSRDSERKHITREIHDTIGYTLTNIIMMMEAGIDLSDSDRLKDLLVKTRDQAREGLKEVRSALHILRNEEEEKPDRSRSIYTLIKTFRIVTGIDVRLEFGNLSSYPKSTDSDAIIYRIIQEGLINAFRHGKATRIRILFWNEPEGLRISIHDNGRGCQDIKEGIGMQGMRERVEQVGGWIRADNVFDGFELKALLPIKAVYNG
ncbi:MAG: sensor histidine kinase [Spirochaetales bacterium]|nr:sensor histidine kinase [Spirochaetales bacterium]